MRGLSGQRASDIWPKGAKRVRGYVIPRDPIYARVLMNFDVLFVFNEEIFTTQRFLIEFHNSMEFDENSSHYKQICEDSNFTIEIFEN